MAEYRVRLVRYEDGEEIPVKWRKVYFCFGFGRGVGTAHTDEDGHATYECDLDTPRDVEIGVDFDNEILDTYTFEDGVEVTVNVSESLES